MRLLRALRSGLLWRPVGAVVSALLLASAFAPGKSPEAAWFGLVPLILVARFSRPRAAFRWGLLSGSLFWLLSLSWLLMLGRTGGAPVMAFLGWVLLALYCGLYTGAFAMVLSAVWAWRGSQAAAAGGGREAGAEANEEAPRDPFSGTLPRNLAMLAAAPLIWVGLEYLRSTLFTGFPWNALGVSQYANPVVIQAAEWGGVYAVSAALVLMNGAIAATVLRAVDVYGRRERWRLNVEMMVGLGTCAALWLYGLNVARRLDAAERGSPGATVKICAVQPNVSQCDKWSPEMAEDIVARLRTATELASLLKPDLLIWPETAVPAPIPADSAATDFVKEMAGQGTPLLAGAIEQPAEETGSGPAQPGGATPAPTAPYFNSAFLVEPDGRVAEVYRKRHLVPFGEYIPLERRLPFLSRLAPLGFSCSAGGTSTVFRLSAGGAAFSSLICFEDAFANLARESVRNGAGFLVNQANDAWFEGTAAGVQHMSHSIFRCVENRVPMVRCANLGVTCFIDRLGRLDPLTRDSLSGRESGMTVYRTGGIPLPAGDSAGLTVYTRYGDRAFALPCAILAAVLFVLVAWRERRENGGTVAAEGSAAPASGAPDGKGAEAP